MMITNNVQLINMYDSLLLALRAELWWKFLSNQNDGIGTCLDDLKLLEVIAV